MNKMTIRDIDVTGQRVLVRVDFNVPLDPKTSAITDDSRIRAVLPTINYLLKHQAKIILLSHFGRPKGKVVEEMRLAPTARRLGEILHQTIAMTKDCIGPEVEKTAAALKPGDILLLENLRFHPEEEKGEEAFAKALAGLGDVYVNDAFGTSHRAHASISGIPHYLPAVAGFLLEKEINTLGGLLESPEHPFTALFGGAKVSDKVALLKNIMDKVDCLLIGGGMAATFLKAKGYSVGTSAVESDIVDIANDLLKAAEKNNVCLLLPVDVIVADKIDSSAVGKAVNIEAIPSDQLIADIGPKTITAFEDKLQQSRTVFWNGTMGVAEIPQFAKGTNTIARILPQLKAKTILGGGSTAETITSLGLADKVTFVSTGGGASLEFLGGDALPGVVALRDKIE
jgi:phosphoglycerate kinase